MAYIPSECSLEEYERVIYSGDAKNRLYVKHGDTIIGTNGDNNASPFASKLTLKRRILKNGSKTFTLNNFVSQEIDLVLHDYNIEDLTEEIEIKIGTYIDSLNDYVYVPLGKFLIQDNPTTDKNKTTYKLRDFSVKFDFYYNAKPLIDDNGGSVTKIQILKDICKKANVTCNIESFIGSDDLIGIYDNSITARSYITYLAEQAGCIAYITRTGKLDFKTISSNNLIKRTIDKSIIEKFTSGDSFKVSKVIYESGIIKFEDGNDDYDTLYISPDNPYIANQQQLERILPNIINFEINSFTTGKVLGNPTIDPFDLIIIEYDNIIYKTLAQYTLNFSGTMVSTYDTKIEHETKQSNISTNGASAIKRYVKTEIDNIDAQLKLEIGNFEEDNKKEIAEINLKYDELNSKISDIADITTSAEDTDAKVELENINKSEPIRIVIRPIGESISNLIISSNMLISDNLKLKKRVIRFTNTNTNEIFDYELPNDLFYYDNENYDEFILDYDGQSCVINKKVGLNEDGTTYLLEKPTTVEYEFPVGDDAIILTEGNYVVEILGYDSGYIFARLMAKNIYTTQFYTKSEVDSEISQTANTITSDIDAKLKNYSTTKEMNNTITQSVTDAENSIKSEVSNIYTTKEETTELTNTIEQKITDEVNSINLEVNKKANTTDVNASLELKIDKNDNNQVVSMINASAEEINLKSNRFSMESDKSKINNDGTVLFTGGKIGGWTINEKNLSCEIKPPYDYTSNDVTKLQKYLSNQGTLTDEEKIKYDVNNDGSIGIDDLLRMQKCVIYGLGKSTPAKLLFDTNDWFYPIKIIDSNGERLAAFGFTGIYTKSEE